MNQELEHGLDYEIDRIKVQLHELHESLHLVKSIIPLKKHRSYTIVISEKLQNVKRLYHMIRISSYNIHLLECSYEIYVNTHAKIEWNPYIWGNNKICWSIQTNNFIRDITFTVKNTLELITISLSQAEVQQNIGQKIKMVETLNSEIVVIEDEMEQYRKFEYGYFRNMVDKLTDEQKNLHNEQQTYVRLNNEHKPNPAMRDNLKKIDKRIKHYKKVMQNNKYYEEQVSNLKIEIEGKNKEKQKIEQDGVILLIDDIPTQIINFRKKQNEVMSTYILIFQKCTKNIQNIKDNIMGEIDKTQQRVASVLADAKILIGNVADNVNEIRQMLGTFDGEERGYGDDDIKCDSDDEELKGWDVEPGQNDDDDDDSVWN